MTVRNAARLVVALVVLAATVVIASRLDPRRVLGAFSGVSWGWVIVAGAINVGNTVIESWRWVQVASPLGRSMGIRSAFLAIVSGVAGGVVLPFKLGDGVRTYVFARAERLRVSQALGTVVADRLVDLLAFVVIALAAWLVVPLPGSVGTAVHAVSGGLAGLLVVLAVLAASQSLRRWLRDVRRSRTAARLGRGLDALAHFGQQLPLGRVAAAAFASWLARCAVIWAMMQAFHLQVPAAAALAALIVINVGITVAGVPGNVGSFELATAGALAIYSQPLETGVSYGLALHAVELLPLLGIGGALYLAGMVDVAAAQG